VTSVRIKLIYWRSWEMTYAFLGLRFNILLRARGRGRNSGGFRSEGRGWTDRRLIDSRVRSRSRALYNSVSIPSI
jgi:hypothetical protein